MTHHDAIIPERLRALHRGPDAPRVRRTIERQSASLPAQHAPGSQDTTETLIDPTRL
jgi:hypothetical protein